MRRGSNPALTLAVTLALALTAVACRGDAGAAPDERPGASIGRGSPAASMATTATTTPASPDRAGDPEGSGGSTGPDATAPAERPRRWVALGDSFSAGQGGSRTTTGTAPDAEPGAGRCPRAEADSYARRAQELLSTAGVPVELSVRACGGALVGDVVGNQVPLVDDADVVTITVGGNDAGFFELTSACLGAAGCPDLTADDAQLTLVDNPGDGRTDWQVFHDQLRDTYLAILDRMAPGGRLLVLTYPLPFPETPGACPTGFGFVSGAQAGLVNAIITRLDATIASAVADADALAGSAHPPATSSPPATSNPPATSTPTGPPDTARPPTTARIELLDWRTPTGAPAATTVRTADGREVPSGWNPAGICGVDPMLNGLRFDAEVSDSFHPSDRGLDLAAGLVADAIRRAG